MLENSERSVRGVQMRKSGLLEYAELANQIQGFRILDRWDASEKNKIAAMLENSERSVRGVQMRKSGLLECVELANQIQGFRILDRWDASEKNNVKVNTTDKYDETV